MYLSMIDYLSATRLNMMMVIGWLHHMIEQATICMEQFAYVVDSQLECCCRMEQLGPVMHSSMSLVQSMHNSMSLVGLMHSSISLVQRLVMHSSME